MKLRIKNTEGKEKRVGSLITTITLFLIACLITAISFTFSYTTKVSDGIASLALIAIIPLLLIYYAAALATSISSTFAGISTATSLNKAYKITGIVFAVLSVALVGLNIFTAVRVFGLI